MASATRTLPKDWKGLQNEVANVLNDCGFAAEAEKEVQTVRGSINLDVYGERYVNGHRMLLVCECKHWQKSVPKTVVHSFRSVVGDLGADVGYVISSAGFQSGAYAAAQSTNIKLVTWEQFLDIFAPFGPPIGPGLKSTAQIGSGTVKYTDKTGVPKPWVQTLVTGGYAERDDTGHVVVYIETEASAPAMQQTNEQIGYKGLWLKSESDVLSDDLAAPTVLLGRLEFALPAGTKGIHPTNGGVFTLPMPVEATVPIRASGHLADGKFQGTWSAEVQTSLTPFPIHVGGTFSVRILSL